jgi:uncharacterized protein YehS (DUF1456 family)
MELNDIFRRLRYALDASEDDIVRIYSHQGHTVKPAAVTALLKKEDKEGYVACTHIDMELFLDGLITERRGARDPNAPPRPPTRKPLTNNMVLKKLRIAMDFKETDMLAVLKLGGMEISSSELSALFRKESHRHHRECGDQMLRNFLNGLSAKLRKTTSTGSAPS